MLGWLAVLVLIEAEALIILVCALIRIRRKVDKLERVLVETAIRMGRERYWPAYLDPIRRLANLRKLMRHC